ncbi:MAG TPA: hypothetical protein VKF63_04035 [Terracidiphilus sp.]|nr:hypothetical protein [Terracidiphilus sp.]
MRMIAVIMAVVMAGATALAQTSVPPPPQPASESQSNATVLKLLRSGVSERAILHVISAGAGTFDTSPDALAALKQAGASEAELSAIASQGAAPANAPPAGGQTTNGPSLEVTMKFIQDKLNALGTVNFAGYVHDASNNTDGVQKFSATISNVVANPGACSLSYHRLVYNNGRKEHNEDVFINLREVQNISVLPDEQDWQMYLVRTGDSTKTVKDVPDITALVFKLNNGKDPTIRFYEQELADRVAKALVHAVELCGGGPKQEPF